jgi:hypothetical protein
MTRLTNYTLAALLALLLASGHLLDGPDDMRAEWDQSQALKELQASQAGTQRREAAAQALCSQERGPNSEARFTPEGHLVCTTRRGVVRLAAVQP